MTKWKISISARLRDTTQFAEIFESSGKDARLGTPNFSYLQFFLAGGVQVMGVVHAHIYAQEA